jgi:hypothetical protein
MEKYTYLEVNKIYTKSNNNNRILLGNNKQKTKNEEEELKKISEKLKEERKINNLLKSENEKLFQDIITIKSNIKSLIPSMSQNKKYPFPTLEQLIEEIKTYLTIDSVKYYQRLQNRQFPLDITILHFKYILQKSQELLHTHFSNVDFILNKKFKSQELIKPIQSVLKNAYQVDWKNICNKITTDEYINKIVQEIKQNITIKLNKKNNNNISNFISPTYLNHLKEYIKTSINILLKCYLNIPKIYFDITKIGKIEKFNSTSNECFMNEKILRGWEVVIVFPSFFYNADKLKKKETINKDKVVANKLNEKSGNYNNNYGTNNSGYSYKNKNSFNNNYFTKKYEEEQDNNNYYNRNKINEIYTGYRNNNYSWSNNNKNLNCRMKTNQNIKKIYFHPKDINKGDEDFIDSEKEDFKFYKK